MISTKVRIRISSKGQVVIPKIVRESIGLRENTTATMEIKEKSVEIRPFPVENIAKKWKAVAEKHGGDARKLVYGDRLYAKEFG
ncbi:MAG: AbrB/MazE/SpoVT family DNA-binding domain-containing protein [Candidatus Aenigmarchaeota archaeon]|nr:AbrB/MazE/SpoVT family DNA-binding domain-containing protein [Candidatus Aenigmarchaeota archaeon]